MLPFPDDPLNVLRHQGYSLEEDQTGGMEDLICKHLPLRFGNLLGFVVVRGSILSTSNDVSPRLDIKLPWWTPFAALVNWKCWKANFI